MLCGECLDQMKLDIFNQDENVSSQDTFPSQSTNGEEFVDLSSAVHSTLSRIQNVCSILEVSPVKTSIFNKLNSDQRLQVLKRKADNISLAVVEDLSSAYNSPYVPINHSLAELTEKSTNLDSLVEALKEKFLLSNTFSERIQLLTLTPDSWSRDRVMKEFQVSEHVVRAARKLKEEKGILPSISSKPAGNRLSQSTIDAVTTFYLDEEISRYCPGMKDFKTVDLDGKKVPITRRLLLFNLKEAHYMFQQENPSLKIGLSKFCSLRPKWCITADSSGSHNVCVCIKHQNPKLMLTGADIGVDYKYCLNLLACSLENECCMFGLCPRCPSPDALTEFLFENLDDYESVTYSEWTTVDRTNLLKIEQSVEDFVPKLVSLLLELRSHHFLSKVQANYYKSLKEDLKDFECLITLDFAENYSFECQDEVQGAHWTNNQATVHPFVIYYKKNDELLSKSFCVISDSLKHDATAVHSFLEIIIAKTKVIIPGLLKVFFFSDGGPGHYKNRFNFANLSFFETDYSISAVWHFWATCHGKNACDGVGGTVKRLARRASRQLSFIMTPLDLYNWAVENIPGIDFAFVTKEDISVDSDFLLNRMNSALTIPGTQKFHCFEPLSKGVVRVARTSIPSSVIAKETFTVVPILSVWSLVSLNDLFIDDYVAVVFMDQWWIGKVLDIDENGVNTSFFAESGPSLIYTHPRQQNEVFIETFEILAKIIPPKPRTRSARSFVISAEEREKICEAFEMYKSH